MTKDFNGDLDALIERRAIRVAAPFSRTLYFNDKGRERGISADFVRDFETLRSTRSTRRSSASGRSRS